MPTNTNRQYVKVSAHGKEFLSTMLMKYGGNTDREPENNDRQHLQASLYT